MLFDEETIRRAKALAARRHTGYKAILQEVLRRQFAGDASVGAA